MSNFNNASLIVTPNGKKVGKLYSIKPSNGTGDLDVVRATSATRVNSAGLIESVGANIARLDYSNGSCPSILVEPQRTNLILQSNNFSNSVWRRNNSPVEINTPDTSSPDGSYNATKYIAGNNIDWLNTNYAITVIETQPYTFSFFAKRGDTDWVMLSAFSTMNGAVKYSAWFNLATGQKGDGVSLSGGTFISNSIKELDNGWYRIKVTGKTNDVTTIYPTISSSAGNLDNTRVPNSIYYIYQSQLEAGLNATSIIPTTTTTVTRNADVISKSGISSLIGQTEGTFYSEIQFFEGGARFNGIELFGNSVNRINISKDTNDLITVGFQANSINTTVGSFNSSYNKVKIAIRYKSGNSVVYVNGVNVGSSSAIFNFTATLTTLNCNLVSNTIYTIHGRLLSCAVFPLGLTNSELQKLTTL